MRISVCALAIALCLSPEAVGAAPVASSAPSPEPKTSPTGAVAVPAWEPDPAPTVAPDKALEWQAQVLIGRLLEPHCAQHGGLTNGWSSVHLNSMNEPYPAQLLCRDGKIVRVESPR